MAIPQPSQQVASHWKADEYDPRPLQDHQKAMIAACESGDLPALQQLFETHSVKRGDPPIQRYAPESGAPATWRLITAAVAHQHPSVVNFLLSTYPKVNIRHGTIVRAVLDDPDVETLEILQSHLDPHSRPYLGPSSIATFEWDDHCNTFLTEACRISEDWLIYYLLDHGANPSLGWFHGGALHVAMVSSRSIKVIQKLFEKGARINLVTIGTAINHQRVDVLKLLFTDSKLSDQVDSAIKEPQKLLEDARKKDNEEVIALIKGYRRARGASGGAGQATK
jgi:hypothetical protein